MVPLHHHVRGPCDESTPCLLSIGDPRPAVVVRHAPLPLAESTRWSSQDTNQVQHAQAQAFHRAQSVRGPDAQAPLCPVCTRDWRDGSSASATTRSHALNEPPPPYGGQLNALLPPPRV